MVKGLFLLAGPLSHYPPCHNVLAPSRSVHRCLCHSMYWVLPWSTHMPIWTEGDRVEVEWGEAADSSNKTRLVVGVCGGRGHWRIVWTTLEWIRRSLEGSRWDEKGDGERKELCLGLEGGGGGGGGVAGLVQKGRGGSGGWVFGVGWGWG